MFIIITSSDFLWLYIFLNLQNGELAAFMLAAEHFLMNTKHYIGSRWHRAKEKLFFTYKINLTAQKNLYLKQYI